MAKVNTFGLTEGDIRESLRTLRGQAEENTSGQMEVGTRVSFCKAEIIPKGRLILMQAIGSYI